MIEAAPRPEAAPMTGRARPRVLAAAAAYYHLTKPRIVLLLLITTVPAMVLAERGLPSLWLVAATLIGGTLSAGGANAINQYLDRDIDEIMSRTRRRPIPAGVIEPWHALAYGIFLGVAGFVWTLTMVNLPAASLSAGALAFYVFVYTIWLKRSSPQNIVIGGAAGAAPALVGWAAVTGRVGWPAVVLFAIVFLWTPPHFWALSLRYQRDYRAAGVPMLPVVVGPAATVRSIVRYSFVLVPVSLLLWPVGHTGFVYPAVAAALGAWFILRALRLRSAGGAAVGMAVFRFSIVYLGLVFAAVALDTLVRYGL